MAIQRPKLSREHHGKIFWKGYEPAGLYAMRDRQGANISPSKGRTLAAILIVTLVFLRILGRTDSWAGQKNFLEHTVIKLPEPMFDSKISVEAALRARKSIRSYQGKDLTLAEVSQLLWAAQGITRKNGMRTVPSAGALYPLELYLVVGQIEQLPVGIYKYRIQGHELVRISDEEKRQALAAAGYGQSCIERGVINIVIAAVYERTARKYGERAVRYVHMEVGHAAQNIYLQAVALELGTVVVGSFDDSRVKKTLLMDADEYPLCIMPVGRARY